MATTTAPATSPTSGPQTGGPPTGTEWPAQRSITDPAAVLLLSDLRALRYLTPFLNDEHTLSSAASWLGCSTSTLAYWIPRFERTGLLVRRSTQQRGGMAMPRYRAPARQLVVPFHSLPFDRRVALLDGGRMRVLRRFLDGLDEALERDHSVALGFSSDSPGGFAVEMVEDDSHRDERSYTDGWMTLDLDEADAQQLAREMDALFERYVGRNGPRRFVAHRGVAPDPRHRWRSARDDDPL